MMTKLAVFYHVFPCEPHAWEAMYQEQMGAVWLSGLYDSLDYFHIGVNGDPSLIKAPAKAVVIENTNKTEETNTLEALHTWAKANPDSYVLYMHTKGISRIDQPDFKYVEDWRHCMEYFTIHNWTKCVSYLDEGYATTGINWQTQTMLGDYPHFSGGFWWANTNYIAALTDEYLLHKPVRYFREFWIGSNNPTVKNQWETGLNKLNNAQHYAQPYPKTSYSKKYLTDTEPPKMTTTQTKPKLSALSWCNPANDIVEILDKHKVNGFEYPGGTDKNSLHNYTGIYDHVLKSYRNSPGTLLEIGIQHGGSSLLWHDYLPQFSLHLVDIADVVPSKIWNSMDEDRYKFYCTNAYDDSLVQRFKEEVPNGFDIIIDDGPHSLHSQNFVVDNYFPLLNLNGILIIEDIQDSNHLDVLTSRLPAEHRSSVRTFDVRRTKGRYDDLIWTVTKTC